MNSPCVTLRDTPPRKHLKVAVIPRARRAVGAFFTVLWLSPAGFVAVAKILNLQSLAIVQLPHEEPTLAPVYQQFP
jgi:hypothetical protein